MIKKEASNVSRIRRHKRIRETLKGTNSAPRLNVFRSNSNIFAQVIDDEKGVTLVSSSSLSLKLKNGGSIEGASEIGKDIALKCKAKKIKKVTFDRGGYLYHGRVKAVAEAARANGLDF